MFSLEFFPPDLLEQGPAPTYGADQAMARWIDQIRPLLALPLDFVSVTNGATGAASDNSLVAIKALRGECSSPIMAHMIGLDKSPSDALDFLTDFAHDGGKQLLVLRGDKRPTVGKPHFNRATDLMAFVQKTMPGRFQFAVAGYPEMHPEDQSLEHGLEVLKRKVDLGANKVVTQFCFESTAVLKWRDRVAASLPDLEIHLGVLPIRNIDQALRFAQRCQASMPADLVSAYQMVRNSRTSDQTQAQASFSSAYLAAYLRQMHSEGLENFHFYCLNHPQPTADIIAALSLSLCFGDRSGFINQPSIHQPSNTGQHHV